MLPLLLLLLLVLLPGNTHLLLILINAALTSLRTSACSFFRYCRRSITTVCVRVCEFVCLFVCLQTTQFGVFNLKLSKFLFIFWTLFSLFLRNPQSQPLPLAPQPSTQLIPFYLQSTHCFLCDFGFLLHLDKSKSIWNRWRRKFDWNCCFRFGSDDGSDFFFCCCCCCCCGVWNLFFGDFCFNKVQQIKKLILKICF